MRLDMAGGLRSALAQALLVVLLVGPAARAAEVEPVSAELGEALVRANESLASPERYPEAIRLYREILAADPGHREARLWLALVLAWKGDLPESLSELAVLRERHPDDLEILVNQGEVLSWSGAYAESLSAFEAVLRERPDDARALRGIARVHRWSGNDWDAIQAYQRALALEDDAEARAEWEELRQPYRPRVEVETRTFSDSSDVDRRDVWMTYSGFQSRDTRLAARLGWIDLSHPQDDVPLTVRSAHDDDRALDLGVRMDHTLDAGPRVTLEAGGRRWASAPDSVYVRGHLEHTLDWLGSLGAHLVHEDFTDASSSFEAAQEGIRHTTLAGSLYRQLGPRIGTFWRIDLGTISDSNSRQSIYGSVGYRPFPVEDLEVTGGLRLARFSDDSDAYYSPEQDLGFELVVDHRIPITPALRAEYTAGLGFASTKELGASESGTLWRAEGRVFWERDRWSVGLRFGVSYSQRSSRYKTKRGALQVERRF